MIKTMITMAIILISVVGMMINSEGIAISNVQATADEGNDTQSSNENAQFSVNRSTQTSDDELPPSDDNNNAQNSGDTNEVISTNQELLPGLEQSNSQVLRSEETPLQTSNTSTKDIQNPDIESEVNQKAISSQNGLRSNYLAEMPVLSDVKDCYKSDGKISLDGQWSCAEYNCTVINGQPKLCTPKETSDDNDKAKHIGNAYDFGLCEGVESDDPLCLIK